MSNNRNWPRAALRHGRVSTQVDGQRGNEYSLTLSERDIAHTRAA
jgi:hypothetical protein